MRHTAPSFIAILAVLITGCSHTDTPMPDITSSAAIQTDTPRSDFTLGAVVQGNWLIETIGVDEDLAMLGTFTIDGSAYRFYPVPGVEVPSWMRDRFCFFEQPVGEVVFEYETGISPNDDVRAFEDNEILLKWAGIGCKEVFLIRIDQESQELYLHAQSSEIQLYRIHKSYAN
jgi:hypothetical protein